MDTVKFVDIDVNLDPLNPTSSVVSVSGLHTVLNEIAPTGRQILDAAGCRPTHEYVLLQLGPDLQLKEIGVDHAVQNITATTRFYALYTDRLFYFVLNGHKYPWGKSVPELILRLLANTPEHTDIWMKRTDEADLLLLPNSIINLSEHGIDHFYTKPATWKLDVQGKIIKSTTPLISVRHALELADINPDLPWIIILKVEGKPKEQASLATILDLKMPGLERLRVTPKIINNGEVACTRREFSLLDRDVKYLDQAEYHWETSIEGKRRWLLIHQYKLPSGYQQSHITLAVEIPLLYPSAELDMFYCLPAVTLQSGEIIPKTETQEAIFGMQYQRWSRHREGNTWSPNFDSIMTHLALVEESLLREVAK